MNKAALKKFATEARRELLQKVELQALKIGITAEAIQKVSVESSDAVFIDGKQLSDTERSQRNKLIAHINEIGFDRVMEETAYTWFNRFIALRYMEVNDYLPTKVRVLSSNSDSMEPDMMKEALSLDLELDKEHVYDLKMNNKTDELFKYLIKIHCNDLNRFMPFMFETIEDYSEILFPEGLLGTDSFVRQMTDKEVIPEDNWEKVEVIGWLYQYYIVEEKEEVFADLKKGVKISKEKVPAATQIFTPNWIVGYLVENSLGRTWLESYPESSVKSDWKYYLEEAEQKKSVLKQLEDIRYENVNPEEITFLDPSCGSGHILIYAYDLFYEMYLEKGYIESEIPKLILEKNLYGLDVDNRAAQLASFAVMMKARKNSRRIFREEVQLNINAIQESNWLTDESISNISKTDNEITEMLNEISEIFIDAKEYGSLLKCQQLNFDQLEVRLKDYLMEESDLLEMIDKQMIEERLPSLIQQSKLLSRKYNVVCTNPPYMGSNGMNNNLSKYLKENYPNTKSDMSTVFMDRSLSLCKESGVIAILNIPVWMFLSSYEKQRQDIISNNTILSMLHLGRGVFGSDFGTTAFVISKSYINQYEGVYRKLFKKQGAVDRLEQKEKWFFEDMGYYTANQENFSNIPGSPIAYWVKESTYQLFSGKTIGDYATTRLGMSTANNDRFMRNWFEVSFLKTGFGFGTSIEALKSEKKWFPYNKGGAFRKWYGNLDHVVNWENDGQEIRNFRDEKTGRTRSHNYNLDYIFGRSITWSDVSSSYFGVRYSDAGSLFDGRGSSLFTDDTNINYILGFMSTNVCKYLMDIVNPTIVFNVGDVAKLPLLFHGNNKAEVVKLVLENIEISQQDWDTFETSWDFKSNPLINKNELSIAKTFDIYKQQTIEMFEQLKYNEETLNRMFIDVYGLQAEITSEVSDKDITISKVFDSKDDIDEEIKGNTYVLTKEDVMKQFVAYAIGCSFGRYSLDEEGLIHAGGEFNPASYETFQVGEDNILPILSGPYFENDIVSRFVEFVRVTFGEETLTENLDYVADAIKRRKSETSRETLRRYFMNDFYKDHVRIYKKRPIYWQFTSGREKAFNCLIYMHRYDKSTLSRIRTDYLHEVQIRMDAEKEDLLGVIEGDSTTKEINNAKKELKSLNKKIDELRAYDELLHHMADMQIEIDLDDGVKVNYAKFEGVVAKI